MSLTIRILAALGFGGYAALVLAHLIEPHLRQHWGADAGFHAVLAAPLIIVVIAVVIALLLIRIRPARRR